MSKLELLEMGSLTCILNKEGADKIQEMWNKLPNEEATTGTHQDYLTEFKRVKKDIDKLSKHMNRVFTIANSQLLKARMRDRIASQMDIFNFGLDVEKEE